jgi:hypothetical protein
MLGSAEKDRSVNRKREQSIIYLRQQSLRCENFFV